PRCRELGAPRRDPRSGPRDSRDQRRRVAAHLTGGRRPQVATDVAGTYRRRVSSGATVPTQSGLRVGGRAPTGARRRVGFLPDPAPPPVLRCARGAVEGRGGRARRRGGPRGGRERSRAGACAGGETLRNVEIRMRHRDGSIRHGLLSANALFEGEQFIHARCVTRDITDRIQAEQALAQFKAMVESADDAVIGKTLEGLITSWNAAATRLYGYAADEVIGKPIAMLVPPDGVDELAEILERLRRGEHIEHRDTTRVR